ncbi:MAG: PHB depolymerase family esterase [Pseudomonadota bacterium]|nr:PHB depolymerase family esterase [Pseudomonadota bacterium]
MRRLSDTIARLTALRRDLGAPMGEIEGGPLEELAGFGSNPGKLRAAIYLPESLRPGAPLVVVLHGCTQNAAGFNRGSGWSELADRHGFALLYPEQRRGNNPNLCFNWYAPADARRGRGEAASIRQMVVKMIAAHDVDPARIFVTGLSAGGAMTAVMLATYPELFAGGAIIAGLPFATADTVSEALERMRGQGGPDDRKLAALTAGASKHDGPWPTLSVWHGSSDTIVDPVNAEAIVSQWRSVQGIEAAPATVETVDGHRRRAWTDAKGREVIEQYDISGMGHGVPLDSAGNDSVGSVGAHMLEAGISSTNRIAQYWGLSEQVATKAERPVLAKASPRPRVAQAAPAKPAVTRVIEDALRAAGLMR